MLVDVGQRMECKQTFFLRLEGREGDSSSGRSVVKSLRAESRRARWVRFDGLTMVTQLESRSSWFEGLQEQGHAGRVDADGGLKYCRDQR